MILRWGDYSFADQSTSIVFSLDTLVNDRGVQFSQVRRAQVTGYINADGSAAISTACLALEAALATPYRDLVLYDNSSARTHVVIGNANSLTGTIPNGPVYPDGRGAELVTYRKFTFSVMAEYPLVSGKNVLQSYHEQVSIQGDGGAQFVMKPALRGVPQKQWVQEFTTVRAVQSGHAVGYLTWPAPPPPLWPADEHRPARSIVQQFPRPRGKGFQDFPISWSYQFESISPLVGAAALLQNILSLIG